MRYRCLAFVVACLLTAPASAQSVVTALQELTAPEPTSGYGRSIDMTDDLLVVSAPFTAADGLVSAGVLYVYRREGGIWTLDARLMGEQEGQRIGRHVAVEADAGRATIVASVDDGNYLVVFEDDGTGWQRTQRLDLDRSSSFSRPLDLDAGRLVVGDDDTYPYAVYFFERGEDGRFRRVAKLTTELVSNHFMGARVAISGDFAIASSSGLEPYATKIYSMARRDGTWVLEGTIDTPRSVITSSAIAFDDGWLALQGTFGVEPGGEEAVYIYRRVGSQWDQEGRLTPHESYVRFGTTLAVHGDWLAVGAPQSAASGDLRGRVYLYRWQAPSWRFVAELALPDGRARDQLGTRALAMDGTSVVAGSLRDDPETVFAFDYATATDTSPADQLPQQVTLAQGFPNPFSHSTTLSYTLPTSGPVRLTVFDVLGHRVASLVEAWKPAGHHTLRWEPASLNSGVYLAVLRTGTQTQYVRLVHTR